MLKKFCTARQHPSKAYKSMLTIVIYKLFFSKVSPEQQEQQKYNLQSSACGKKQNSPQSTGKKEDFAGFKRNVLKIAFFWAT